MIKSEKEKINADELSFNPPPHTILGANYILVGENTFFFLKQFLSLLNTPPPHKKSSFLTVFSRVREKIKGKLKHR